MPVSGLRFEFAFLGRRSRKDNIPINVDPVSLKVEVAPLQSQCFVPLEAEVVQPRDNQSVWMAFGIGFP